jgi:hypothetical protein
VRPPQRKPGAARAASAGTAARDLPASQPSLDGRRFARQPREGGSRHSCPLAQPHIQSAPRPACQALLRLRRGHSWRGNARVAEAADEEGVDTAALAERHLCLRGSWRPTSQRCRRRCSDTRRRSPTSL